VFCAFAVGVAEAQTLSRGPFIQNPDALTTTMTITWWTNTVGDSTVEYGTTTGLGSSVNVGQAASCEVGAAGTCHTVSLSGLQPNTRYFYQLKTNGVIVQAVSSAIYFTTALEPTDTSELYFTVVGDWGQGTSGYTNIANRLNAADAPLVFTVGDNAYTNGTQSDWDNNALAAYQTLMKRQLFMPILGNHDLNNVGPSNWANSVEIKMFQMPRNAPAGDQERYWYYESGDALFIGLDANPPA
jgi:hypothetical protein